MLRTWPRTALLVLGAMCQHSVDAQLGDPLHRLLNGDSLAPPNYDTAYIATYRSRLVVSTVCKYRFADIDLERADDEGTLSFSTNSNEQYGFGIDYKWLSAEVTFNVPVLNQYDPSLGRTDSRNFGLGYTGRRLWIRGFWDRTEGYFMNEADRWLGERPGAAPYTRPDLNSDTYMLSVNYALSLKKRFSQNAAIAQMERQKRSAGTWLAGLSAWRNTARHLPLRHRVQRGGAHHRGGHDRLYTHLVVPGKGLRACGDAVRPGVYAAAHHPERGRRPGRYIDRPCG
jgi:hypothetical protein